MKGQDKILEKKKKQPNGMEISNLTEKEFKVMVIKMLMELGRGMENTVGTSTKSHKI